jgi:hypothetical protein
MRLLLATAASAIIGAAFATTADARVIRVDRIDPGSCALGLTVDGTFVLLNGASGVVAETDVPAFPGAPFNVDQVFTCHGNTPPGLVTGTMRIAELSPTPAGTLMAHITITPTVWTFAVVRTGSPNG